MATDPFDLTGRVAIVTGGSRGLGRCIAFGLAQRGADIVVASRKGDACEKTATEIREGTGRHAIGVAFHAGKWADPEMLLARTLSEYDRIDIVINNAGMSPLFSSLPEVTEDLFDKTTSVNYKGPFRLCALAGEWMAQHHGGSIVNVSSIASVAPTPVDLVYAGAKAALNAMTVGLAQAYGPTVRANVLMAGPFLTDVAKAWDMDQFNATAQQMIPLRRAGDPSEIVGAAVYLASDASSYTTGAILKVDGGATRSTG